MAAGSVKPLQCPKSIRHVSPLLPRRANFCGLVADVLATLPTSDKVRDKSVTSWQQVVVMEFGKRHDTTDTADFCPHQLFTDLLPENLCNRYWPLVAGVINRLGLQSRACVRHCHEQWSYLWPTMGTMYRIMSPIIGNEQLKRLLKTCLGVEIAV